MTERRQLRLGAFMRPVSIHTAWWRYPGAYSDANFNFRHIARFAQTLERGKFDAFFMADHLALLNMPMNALKRSATSTSFDPLTLLPALAVMTERLGLIATASTTFNDPYHIARKFASLDHISNGRAAWNLVTTSNPEAALNFGLEEHVEHAARYRIAREFYDVVTGLWDSWADDAFIRDVENGIFFDPERMHVLNHKGDHFSVRGPLNIARPIQGWPVIVQAGASDDGRQIAAETAEMVFAAGGPMAEAQRYYADVKGRAEALGRERDHLKILPGALVVVGETAAEAQQKRDLLDSLVHPDSGIGSLSIALGCDASTFDLDGPLPEIPETNQSKSGRQRVVDRARRENLTVRQLAQIAGGYGGLSFTGTPRTIADQMEEWLFSDACDGFNVMFPYVPGGLDDFVNMVVPELQRRGLFRTEYEGRTLRENLGLPRPANRFFPPSLRLMSATPLAGVRVLEFSHTVMGPTAGLIFAELGADVIKIEPAPKGDHTRGLGGFAAGFFAAFSRNKRSLAVDLKTPEGQAIIRRLVATADLVLENYGPGTMERLGCGYDQLAPLNPRLIYLALKGYLAGPYEHRPALDEVVQFQTGLAFMTGPIGQPLRAGASVIDILGAVFGVVAAQAALREREQTGRGQRVGSALFETAAFLMSTHMAGMTATGLEARPMPARRGAWAIYEVFKTANDGQLFIGVTSDQQWSRFVEEFSLQELAADPRLASNFMRLQERAWLIPALQEVLANIPQPEAEARCERANISWARVGQPGDLFTDPHLLATGGLLDVFISRIGGTEGTKVGLPALPIEFGHKRDRPGIRRQSPRMGEHSREILAEAGYSDAEIGALSAGGIIVAPAS